MEMVVAFCGVVDLMEVVRGEMGFPWKEENEDLGLEEREEVKVVVAMAAIVNCVKEEVLEK